MADSRIYALSEQTSEDVDLCFGADKTGLSDAVHVKWSTLKGWANVGDFQYTAENYVNTDEDLTTSIDALDIQLKAVADQLSASVTNLFLAETWLSASEILSLYSIPVEIVTAPGAYTYIDILSAVAYFESNGFDFTSANDLLLVYDGETTGIYEWDNTFIESTGNACWKGVVSSNVILQANKALDAYVPNANPSGGNGRIKMYILYRKVVTPSPA